MPYVNLDIEYLDVKILPRWTGAFRDGAAASEGTPVKRILFGPDGRLRNGWWILVFLALMLASGFAYTPASRALQASGASPLLLEPLRFAFLLLVTWLCVRLRREPLSSVGFQLDRRWAREFGVGSLLGLATALFAVALIWSVGGVRLALDPERSVGVLLRGTYVFLFVALFEETLFRGFVFQRLVAGTRPWIAQLALGLLFATGHWENPGMEGSTMAWATLELFLGAVLLGLAWLRTHSLALPIGIHLGWNWTQGTLLGFGVSGFEHAGWFRPELLDRPEWISGGAFGPEASVFAVVVDLVLIGLLWRWKGSRPRTPAVVARSGGADNAALPVAAAS
jgi:membrane protease YdiL (CAAX protease family)